MTVRDGLGVLVAITAGIAGGLIVRSRETDGSFLADRLQALASRLDALEDSRGAALAEPPPLQEAGTPASGGGAEPPAWTGRLDELASQVEALEITLAEWTESVLPEAERKAAADLDAEIREEIVERAAKAAREAPIREEEIDAVLAEYAVAGSEPVRDWNTATVQNFVRGLLILPVDVDAATRVDSFAMRRLGQLQAQREEIAALRKRRPSVTHHVNPGLFRETVRAILECGSKEGATLRPDWRVAMERSGE